MKPFCALLRPPGVENDAFLRYSKRIVTSGVLSLEEWWRGFFYFIFFFLMHVLLWRFNAVKKSFVSLLTVFIVIPSLLYGIVFTLGWVAWEWFTAWLLHVCLATNYIAAYPAVAAQSPTIEILHALNRHPEGIAWQDLLTSCPMENAVDARIADLLRAGLIRATSGSYELTPKGRLLAKTFTVFRNFLNLPEGVG